MMIKTELEHGQQARRGMLIKRSKDEVMAMHEEAVELFGEQHDTGKSDFPPLSYEEGVFSAIEWMLDLDRTRVFPFERR
jgi:hypothetical protein